MKIVNTLIRGAIADAEEAVFDANALQILGQQLREAAQAVEHSKRELACAMAHHSSELRAIEALDARVKDLEASGREALSKGREDLAREASVVVAALEDERGDRQKAVERFDRDITRLKCLVEDGRQRLADLRRGFELARAEEALHRAGANGRKALISGAGALREAEGTLARIKTRQQLNEDAGEALDAMERDESGRDLEDRLARAGFGSRLRTNPDDVLARMRKRDGNADESGGSVPQS
ncbi:MAG: PspA/IM30 family protein [Alphaproteobacteria bacterium]|nr:PspA/IM30 family protein [Alphaproteobacteria bacterium]